MSRYDAQFEKRIELYRRRQRLLLANSINFKASSAEFKDFCRSKLTQPETAKFFWQPGDKAGRTHRGWAMIGFETRPDCARALEELKDLRFRNREVKIQRSNRKAHPPLQHAPLKSNYVDASTQTDASAPPANPSTTTTNASTSEASIEIGRFPPEARKGFFLPGPEDKVQSNTKV